jgi:hypothetical protein
MGNVAEVSKSIQRAWEMEPTSARIVEDILTFPRVLQNIIDNEMKVLPDEFLRFGRGQRNAADINDLKRNQRSRQRKQTLVLPPVHPDLQDAYNKLLRGDIEQQYLKPEDNPLAGPNDSELENYDSI